MILGFQILRLAKALVAWLEPATEGSLQISGWIRDPVYHQRPAHLNEHGTDLESFRNERRRRRGEAGGMEVGRGGEKQHIATECEHQPAIELYPFRPVYWPGESRRQQARAEFNTRVYSSLSSRYRSNLAGSRYGWLSVPARQAATHCSVTVKGWLSCSWLVARLAVGWSNGPEGEELRCSAPSVLTAAGLSMPVLAWHSDTVPGRSCERAPLVTLMNSGEIGKTPCLISPIIVSIRPETNGSIGSRPGARDLNRSSATVCLPWASVDTTKHACTNVGVVTYTRAGDIRFYGTPSSDDGLERATERSLGSLGKSASHCASGFPRQNVSITIERMKLGKMLQRP
ncbi:hypothetical protein PoB_007313400 [Plakobranchus ocellatus]|uniref:Uncharacterized protein n=1 Tax=Plakobranchus ocellatus TaxID=259542 RepID=A0AAV4DQZ2_9GAST|nr:hypothetical protein PoB_007313400 [Plakobranchus ocellatus]